MELRNMNRLMLCAIVAGSLAAASSTLAESPRVKVGTLTCREAHGWGLILGSSRHVDCVFSNGANVERYAGSINKFGADVGYKAGAKIVWAVIAPADRPDRGALAGHYYGGTASATAGLGLGAHALLGGFDRSIALQPLSVEGNRGLDVAAGVGELTLRNAA
jgi:hypothetical protein